MASQPSPVPQIHVLAVDDSIIERKAMEKLLTTSSFKVTTVESGWRALDILCTNAYCINLIITDYCMPGMSGYELLKKVKETSALKEIPVVVMSSENVPNRISRCLAEGAEEFILKPLQLSDVKRLKGHIAQPKLQAADPSLPDPCGCCKRRRRMEAPPDALDMQSPAERRLRVDAVISVTSQ